MNNSQKFFKANEPKNERLCTDGSIFIIIYGHTGRTVKP